MLSLAFALTAFGCTPERDGGSSLAAKSEKTAKPGDAVSGIANSLGEIQRGNDSGFGAAADATR